MRWFWIDRFTEFVRHTRATAIKAVTLAEEHLHDHFPGAAVVPATLILEGMAQAGGILVADNLDYKLQVVLAKVAGADFHFEVVPGDVICFDAVIVETMPGGRSETGGGRPLLRPPRGRDDDPEALQGRGDARLDRPPADLRGGHEPRRLEGAADGVTMRRRWATFVTLRSIARAPPAAPRPSRGDWPTHKPTHRPPCRA